MSLILAMILLLCGVCSADKLRVETDSTTGIDIHYVTSEPCMNTITYPTCRTWSRDGKYLFVESDRPRPDGTKFMGERQLLKVNIETGEVTHLASLEVENTERYGNANIRALGQYHFDYAPEANVLVYYDMTGHNMYLLDVVTGKRERILHESEGTIGDPPAITPDGKRVVYYVRFPSIANRFLGSATSVIFALDVDPKKLKAVGEPKIITAYQDRIITETAARKYPKFQIINHCQVNPTNPDHYFYAHQFEGVKPDGSLTLTRIWENRDGIDSPVYRSGPGYWQTHEVVGPTGRNIYFVENWNVVAVDFKRREKRIIYECKGNFRAWHITVSPDEKWVAADVMADGNGDADGLYPSGILLIETATGKSKLLCQIPRGLNHPRHPHPNFSPDGKRIAFVVPEGKDGCQVAYIEVR